MNDGSLLRNPGRQRPARSVYFVLMASLLLVFAHAYSPAAFADSISPPRDYTKVTVDGRYIFVMLVGNNSQVPLEWSKVEEIRSKYSQSGLYKNDGSTTPLWTVDWYGSVDLSSDGHHLIRWGPWPLMGHYAETALTFCEDGREINSYRIDQLVTLPILLPNTTSHFDWLRSADLDEVSGLLTVQTQLWDSYVFDVRTGGVVTGIAMPFLPKCLILPVALVISWIAVRSIYRKKKAVQR